MKKISFLLLLFFAKLFFAQQDINETFGQQMANTFSPLDKSKVPNGLLLDIAMEFTDVTRFNGTLTDSTYVRPSTLKSIYNTLLMSRVRDVTSGMVTPEIFENQWFAERSENAIALSGLYFKYAKFADNALSANKLTYSNGKFYDKYTNGVWQNPYQEMRTFAISAPIMAYTGQNLSIKLPQNIFYSNASSEIQKIELDAGDGLGFRLLPYNQNIVLSYTTDGEKTWKYKLTLINGQTLLSHSKIFVRKGLRTTQAILYEEGKTPSPWGNCSTTNTDVYYRDMVSSTSFLGKQAKARIFIDDAGGDCKITKPLIVVEGWDVTTLLSPETKYSSDDYEEFLKSVNQYNSNLKDLLINQKQYDIIYVNWDNGMDYIERNALVVEEIIKWVNQVKEGTEKTVLIGQSMGGVVGRYAIRDLEQHGYTHNIRLFVSHDSPQQGANIPLSIQNFYRNMRRIVVRSALLSWLIPVFTHDVSANDLFSILDQPATKEMLMNRIDINYNIDNQTFTNFYAMMDAKGYPSQNGIRNIAISNGSECGSHQNFNEGDFIIKAEGKAYTQMLGDIIGMFILPSFNGNLSILVDSNFLGSTFLSILPGNSRYEGKLNCNALYQIGGNQIYEFRLTYYKKILWVIPAQSTIFETIKYQPSGLNLHYDNYGGGYVNMKDYAGNVNGSASQNYFLFGGYSYSAYMRDKFTLVPTPSALGIKATTDENYERTYVGANPPSPPLTTPFDNFTTAFTEPNDFNKNNETHISFTARNGNWLANEMSNPNNPYTTNCSFICSATMINGNSVMCDNAQYSVPSGVQNYIWSIEGGDGNLTISGNGTSTISINNPNSYNGNFILKVRLLDNFGKCDVTLSKNIWVGVPQFNRVECNSGPTTNNSICDGIVYESPNNLPALIIGNSVRAIFDGMTPAQTLVSQNWQWENINNLSHVTGVKDRGTVALMDFGTTGFRVRAKNDCGWSDWAEWYFDIVSTGSNYFYRVSPNPTTDNIIIDLKDKNKKPKSNGAIAKIYDVLGNQKAIINLIDNKGSVNISAFPTGIYYLKIKVDNKTENINFIKK